MIDATGAKPEPNMTVVIKNNRIASIGKSGKVRVPRPALVVNARGQFLIPGLWDMHVHTSDKSFLNLFIANGVTGVRDMGGSPKEFELLQQWRAQIRNKTLVGPRIVAAGTHVDGPKPTGRPNSLNASSAAEGRQAVDILKERGADFIKVYSMLSREAYFAIAEEAKRQKLPFAGHVPAAISATEASDAGQKSMEHLFGVFTACSSDEVRLRNELVTAVAKTGFSIFVQAEIAAQLQTISTYDDKKAAGLFVRLVQNKIWQVPTLAGWQTLTIGDDSHFRNDLRLKYIRPEKRETWRLQRTALLQSLGTEYLSRRVELFDKQLTVVGEMHRAGIRLMSGTDTAAPFLYPGFSLHDELTLLVQAGLTPMEAVQAATRNPAEFLGLLASLGTVERGKIADLVLLEADPMQEISNTRKIAAVVIAGKLLTKSTLRKMLAGTVAQGE
ncbi:MAG TPA: amidohydrolase family protein [Pyrinomonadaceae bacterium]|nr:amidohydrolase family protein [Pyrinomonadaceae bacterium]